MSSFGWIFAALGLLLSGLEFLWSDSAWAVLLGVVFLLIGLICLLGWVLEHRGFHPDETIIDDEVIDHSEKE